MVVFFMAEKDIREIDKNMKENVSLENDNISWHSLNNDYLMGSAFHNNFERLEPDTYVSENIEVLKRHPAGMYIDFKTNSPFIKIKAMLAGAAYMSHMTAVGTIGFDLYYKHQSKWAFISTTKINSKEYTVDLLKNIDEGMKEYRIYFPLYQALNEAYIGVDKNSLFNFVREEKERFVIYGTSISQGGCASRPGMAYSSILGRLLDVEVINLGFSGSCKLEDEMLNVINKINKKLLILEVEANSPSVDVLKERLSFFLDNLKDKDSFKIYLISHFDDSMCLINSEYKQNQQAFYDLQKSFTGLRFIDGSKIIENLFYEGSVDGVHLTDLGFYELANKLAGIIKDDKI